MQVQEREEVLLLGVIAVSLGVGRVRFHGRVLKSALYHEGKPDFRQDLVSDERTDGDATGIRVDRLSVDLGRAQVKPLHLAAELQTREVAQGITDDLRSEFVHRKASFMKARIDRLRFQLSGSPNDPQAEVRSDRRFDFELEYRKEQVQWRERD